MTPEMCFFAELIMSRQERMLFQDLKDNLGDQGTRNAYVDFLLDNGRCWSAEAIREYRLLPEKVIMTTGSGIVGRSALDPSSGILQPVCLASGRPSGKVTSGMGLLPWLMQPLPTSG